MKSVDAPYSSGQLTTTRVPVLNPGNQPLAMMNNPMYQDQQAPGNYQMVMMPQSKDNLYNK